MPRTGTGSNSGIQSAQRFVHWSLDAARHEPIRVCVIWGCSPPVCVLFTFLSVVFVDRSKRFEHSEIFGSQRYGEGSLKKNVPFGAMPFTNAE